MINNRKTWQDILFSDKIEGGWSPPRPGDPNPTMRGITFAAFQAARAPAEVTIDDLKAITLEECKIIANQSYWLPVQGDKLPSGLDVMVADTSFNSGPGQATKLLQGCLGITGKARDGFLGVQTLQAVQDAQPHQLILDYHDARMLFLRSLPNWEANKNGWIARCSAMLSLALTLAPETAPAVVAATDGKKRWWASMLSIGGVAGTTMLPDLVNGIVGAITPAKAAYLNTSQLLEPYAVYSDYLIPSVGGLVILGILYVHTRALRMASKATAAGSAAEVVTT